MIMSLPVELVDAIAGFLQPADLALFARVTPRFLPTCQRLLYRSLNLSASSHNLDVVFTLAAKPDIARYVRAFTIATLDSTLYHSLGQALSFMTELQNLAISIEANCGWVLANADSSRLSRFTCSFPLDCHVIGFLKNAVDLVELEMAADSAPPPPIPSNFLPNITHFVGGAATAQAILPSRPVSSLQLTSGDVTETMMESLQSLDLAVLAVSTSLPPLPLLQHISKRMPTLSFLQMTTSYSFSTAPDVGFYQDVAHALTSLPLLRAFELSGMHWASHKTDDERVWQSHPIELQIEQEPEDYIDSFFAY